MKKVFITWEEVNLLLDQLYEKCKDDIRYVTGVPRGGTLLAIMFSHRFNIPYMEFKSNHYPDMLILDDIADSGHTLSELREEFSTPKLGALHYKESSSFEPDFYSVKINKDYGWIVYPWEKEDSNTIQDYLDN